MKRRFLNAALFMTAALLSASCGDDSDNVLPVPPEDETPQYEEPVPERPDYVNANLVYYGTDAQNESSDYWVLTLYTDMTVDGGYPIGPGQMLSLAMNTPVSQAQEPELSLLAGQYHMPAHSGDFSAGTYIQGDIYTIDLPDGTVEMPDGTFFGNIPAGETDFDPDLIREGEFSITDNGDGTYTVDGILVGNYYTKRYFTYTGPFEPVDRAGESVMPETPNSNLTADVELSGLTQSRLIDKKDYFFLGDESYRLFLLYLAEPTVDLSAEWPSGTGRLLRLELFVPWEADVADGIPAGTYTMAHRTETSGIPREEIVPFRIVEGYPDNFRYNTGTWYQELANGAWLNYGRITDGTVTVERDGDAHTLAIDLTDCSDPAHRVSGTWTTEGPIGR